MKKDKLYLHEIATRIKKDERYILDLAQDGLIFSFHVTHAELELQKCEKQIEDVINGHELFTTDVIDSQHKKYQYEALDLYPLTPLSLARGEQKVRPEFNIQNWQRAAVHYCEPEYVVKDNIFVKAANIKEYGKKNSLFINVLKDVENQKPGPQTRKREKIKQIFLYRLESGTVTAEDLQGQNQESLAADKEFESISTNRGTIIAARDEAIKEFQNSCQN